MPYQKTSIAFVAATLLLIGTGLSARSAAAGDPAAAGQFLTSLQDDAVAQLTDPGVSEEEKESRFRSLFRKNFDLPAISRFVLGRFWRSAEEEDRADFMQVFEDAMVQRFFPLLAGYDGQRLQIENSREDSKKKDVFIVNSTYPRNEGEPYKLSWRIRNKDAQFRILDVVAEGVSMAITLRSEYGSMIKSSGGKVSTLTAKLRELVEKGAFAPKNL